jgi:hypothetical protein
MDPHHEQLMVIMKAGQEKIEAMMEACLEKTGAMDLEANPKGIESKLEHQEDPKKEAAVETVRTQEGGY